MEINEINEYLRQMRWLYIICSCVKSMVSNIIKKHAAFAAGSAERQIKKIIATVLQCSENAEYRKGIIYMIALDCYQLVDTAFKKGA